MLGARLRLSFLLLLLLLLLLLPLSYCYYDFAATSSSLQLLLLPPPLPLLLITPQNADLGPNGDMTNSGAALRGPGAAAGSWGTARRRAALGWPAPCGRS